MRNWLTPHGSFEGVRGFLCPLTWPAAQFWALGARWRSSRSYRYRAAVPVLSVGNLQVGGTGKTPLAMWLMAHLCDTYGRKPVLVSRGYGRRRSDTHVVQSDDSAAHCGDEPLLVARAGFAVVVGDRAHAARVAVEQLGADVVVLDDGFQQRDLTVDLQIVLWDTTRAGSDACLPYGCLREPLDSLRRTDVLVLRRDAGDAAALSPLAADVVPTLEAGYGPLQLRDRSSGPVSVAAPVVLAAGVGNPARLAASLERTGVRVAQTVALADHCAWDTPDVGRVRTALAGRAVSAVVVTPKDVVKREDWDTLFPVPVYVAQAAFGPCTDLDRTMLDQHLERLWPT